MVSEETYSGGQQHQVLFDTALSSASRNSMPVERYPSGVESCPTDGSEPRAGTNWNSHLIPYRIQAIPIRPLKGTSR